MRTVRLVGNIAKFGEVWEADCSTVRDILKLIDCQTPGFKPYLIQAAEAGVSFEVKRGEIFLERPEELLINIGEGDLVITEIPAGAKSGPAKIFAAAFLVIITGGQYAWVNGIAGSLAITGVTQLLAPGLETDAEEVNDGYAFSGATNNISQGMPVPVAYGELRVGGAPISVTYEPFNPVEIGASPTGSDTTDNNGTGESGEEAAGRLFGMRVFWGAGDPPAVSIAWLGSEGFAGTPPGSGTESDRYSLNARDILLVKWKPQQGIASNSSSYTDLDYEKTGVFVENNTGEIFENNSEAFTITSGSPNSILTGSLKLGYTFEPRNNDAFSNSTTLYFTRPIVEADVDPTTVDAKLRISGPTEIEEGSTSSDYQVYLVNETGDSIPAETDVTVSLSYSGDAVDPTHYTEVSSATINAGSSSQTFSIATVDNGYDEQDDEVFTITASTSDDGGFNSLSADTNENTVTTTIVDITPDRLPGGNEAPQENIDYEFLFESNGANSAVTETRTPEPSGSGTALDPWSFLPGDEIKFKVSRLSGSWLISPPPGFFTEDGDFNLRGRGAGAVSARTRIVADGAAATAEELTVARGFDGSGTQFQYYVSKESGVNLDGKLSLVGPSEVLEGATTTEYKIFLTVNGEPYALSEDLDLTITYGGTAVRGTQYTTASSPTTRTIPAGSSEVTFTIQTSNDANATSETIIQNLSTVAGELGGLRSLAIQSGQVTTTILDNATAVGVGDGNIDNTTVGTTTSRASISFANDGSVSTSDSSFTSSTWSSSTNSAINGQYAVRANVTAGIKSGLVVNRENGLTAWYSLGDSLPVTYSLKAIYSEDTDVSNSATVVFQFAALNDLSTILDTATITLSASNTSTSKSLEDILILDSSGVPLQDSTGTLLNTQNINFTVDEINDTLGNL